MYQITYLDIYIYFRTLEPKITYITLYDDDLFKELTTFLFDENDLIKSSSYRSLTQQQLTLNIILLKKLSIRTLGEYYEQIEYRDRVLRLFYKILTTMQSNELQLIVYESIEKIFNGHQNEQLRLRFVDLYIQKIPFHDYEKLNLTPQIAQTLFYLSKLSPNSFDERLCEQILNLIRRLMQNIAQTFRSIIDTQNQFYKTCLILLDLLAILPSSSKKIIESLTILILKFDKHLMIEFQITDLLIPAIPIRMDDGYDVLAEYTKKILSDDAHGNLQLMHIMTIIVRHQTIYFHVRYILANLMIQSAQKIASQQSNSMEHKKLAIDIIEVIIKWELRKHHEQTNDQKNFNRALIDTIFNFLIRHACQINLQNMLPLSQQCIRLFKIARKFAWPNVDVKLTTFERLIHQIESPNITAHNSIAIAIDLLAFLISTFTVIQIKYTMRTLKRSLITCVSITNYPRLVESMQNLFSKLIIQIPIEPPAAIIPTTATNTQQGLSPQLVQATLASLATATTNNQQSILTNNVPISTHTISKSEDIEQFYTIITKTIIDNMNSTPTSIVNTTDR
ncbi:unnamed protein product [Rotaria sp. Silwood1]|nr:unnamed protein product [Rotaria sp. Silwood1]